MGWFNRRSPTEEFVELPTGIFTSDGLWFHTTVEALTDYAGPVIEKIGLPVLLKLTASWIRSADTAALFFFICSLLLLEPWQAVLATVILYVVWEELVEQLVAGSLVRIFHLLSHPLLQGFIYVVVLSRLGSDGNYLALTVGFAGFVIIRWRILHWLYLALMTRIRKPDTGLPREDRILRMLLLSFAASLRITLSATEAYESRIMEIWRRRNRS